MKKLITILLFTLTGNCLFAQIENIPLITVIGEAAVKVKPDYAILGIKIKKSILLNPPGKATVFEIFKEEDTKIRLFGFDTRDISESVIQVDSSVYIKEVFFTINDLSTLDKYLLELYKLGFKEYVYLDYRVRDYTGYKNEARKEAMSIAKKKAALLSNELGQITGKAHTIKEMEEEDYNWYNIHNNKNLENITFKSGANGYVIEPGFLTIISRLEVSFDLQK